MENEEKKDVAAAPETAPKTKLEPTPEELALKKLREKDDLRTFWIALMAAFIVVAGYHISRQLVRVIVRSNNPPKMIQSCECKPDPRGRGEFRHGGPRPNGDVERPRREPKRRGRKPEARPAEAKKTAPAAKPTMKKPTKKTAAPTAKPEPAKPAEPKKAEAKKAEADTPAKPAEPKKTEPAAKP